MGRRSVSEKQSTILVIEDESQLRKFLRVILETHDYAVIDASTGDEGLRKAAQWALAKLARRTTPTRPSNSS